tara:strand:- start:130 stop:552 length:423 start_codon:yes stop_codon:yes gene_type:complete
MKWIIRADTPYRGNVLSLMRPNGTVEFTNGLTLAGYEKARGYPMRLIDDAELAALDAAYTADRVTAPLEIEADRFDEMLNVLPPSRWHRAGAFEVFHVSERISHNLVNWFAAKGEKYWEFIDRDNVPSDEIACKLLLATK